MHSSVTSLQNLFDSGIGTRVFGGSMASTHDSQRSRNLFQFKASTRNCSIQVRGEILYMQGLHEDEYVSVQALMFKRGNV